MAGLATDYCVNYSAQDARRLGFDTVVVKSAAGPLIWRFACRCVGGDGSGRRPGDAISIDRCPASHASAISG